MNIIDRIRCDMLHLEARRIEVIGIISSDQVNLSVPDNAFVPFESAPQILGVPVVGHMGAAGYAFQVRVK